MALLSWPRRSSPGHHRAGFRATGGSRRERGRELLASPRLDSVCRMRVPESSVELPGVSERRPVAVPVDPPPRSEEPVFVYSPLRSEWVIGVLSEGRWFERATGDELERPTHWMPLPEPLGARNG